MLPTKKERKKVRYLYNCKCHIIKYFPERRGLPCFLCLQLYVFDDLKNFPQTRYWLSHFKPGFSSTTYIVLVPGAIGQSYCIATQHESECDRKKSECKETMIFNYFHLKYTFTKFAKTFDYMNTLLESPLSLLIFCLLSSSLKVGFQTLHLSLLNCLFVSSVLSGFAS